jgi:hypothetical protein
MACRLPLCELFTYQHGLCWFDLLRNAVLIAAMAHSSLSHDTSTTSSPPDPQFRPASMPNMLSSSVGGYEHEQYIMRPASSVTFTFAERSASPVSSIESTKMADTPKSSPSASSSRMDLEKAVEKPEEWKPEKKEWFIMISLSVISFMVALDATILVTVLPVRLNTIRIKDARLTLQTANSAFAQRHFDRCLLGRDIVPPDQRRLPTRHC